jgi:hypothetical protein
MNLAGQQARLARGSMLTAGIGALLCLALAFWFYYGYVKIQEVMTPQVIVQAAESTVMEALPKARAALEKQINESADEWAADFSKQVQENIPEVRRKMEEFVVERSADAIDQFQVLSANQFRTFVQNHQAQLADGFRSLKNQEEAERFVQDLHVAIQEEIGGDMKGQAEDMLHTLVDLNAKLESLAKGERLNHEQALEREILMIARRLQLESHSSQPDLRHPSERPAARRKSRQPTPAGDPGATAPGSGALAADSIPAEPPAAGGSPDGAAKK